MTKKLKFVKKTHTYTVGETVLVSVTKFISQFFKEFNEKEMAKFMAMLSRKRGIKGQGIRYWKKHWKEMSQHGTRVHQFLEHYITSGAEEVLNDLDLKKIQAGMKYVSVLKDELKGFKLVPEVKVFDEKLGLAGTIDVMAVRGKEVYLVDWKTNKKIEQTGYKGAMAKAPVSYLPDCNYTKYALQLNLYRHILERQGYKIRGMNLIHLLPDGNYKTYNIEFMNKEIKDILNEDTKKSA